MKLFGSTKNKITKDKHDETVPHLEINEVVLVHCNIVDNDCQKDSRVLCKFVPNQLFCQLLDISLQNFILLKAFDSDFSYTEVWFIDQNSKLLEIEIK